MQTNDTKERFREVLYAIVSVAESGDFMTRGEMAEVLWDVSKDLEDEHFKIKK